MLWLCNDEKVTKQNKGTAQWSGQSRMAHLTSSRSHLFIDDLPLRSSVQLVTDVLPSRIKIQCCNESLIHRFVLEINPWWILLCIFTWPCDGSSIRLVIRWIQLAVDMHENILAGNGRRTEKTKSRVSRGRVQESWELFCVIGVSLCKWVISTESGGAAGAEWWSTLISSLHPNNCLLSRPQAGPADHPWPHRASAVATGTLIRCVWFLPGRTEIEKKVDLIDRRGNWGKALFTV